MNANREDARPFASSSSSLLYPFLLLAVLLVPFAGLAQQPVSIRVDANQKLGPFKAKRAETDR
ncbi:MAG: hypothetical protein WAO35_28740 [Terriglobia bacterium]